MIIIHTSGGFMLRTFVMRPCNTEGKIQMIRLALANLVQKHLRISKYRGDSHFHYCTYANHTQRNKTTHWIKWWWSLFHQLCLMDGTLVYFIPSIMLKIGWYIWYCTSTFGNVSICSIQIKIRIRNDRCCHYLHSIIAMFLKPNYLHNKEVRVVDVELYRAE